MPRSLAAAVRLKPVRASASWIALRSTASRYAGSGDSAPLSEGGAAAPACSGSGPKGCSARSVGCSSPPVDSATARSSTFSSSRTLPGKSYFISSSLAAGDSRGAATPFCLARRCSMLAAIAGMSSRHSRSGGMRSSITFRR